MSTDSELQQTTVSLLVGRVTFFFFFFSDLMFLFAVAFPYAASQKVQLAKEKSEFTFNFSIWQWGFSQLRLCRGPANYKFIIYDVRVNVIIVKAGRADPA